MKTIHHTLTHALGRLFGTGHFPSPDANQFNFSMFSGGREIDNDTETLIQADGFGYFLLQRCPVPAQLFRLD